MRGNGARSGGATSGTYLPAGPVVGMLTSLPTFLDVVLASRLILVSQVVAAESGPATEGGLQLKKYGVSSLPFLVVGCHVVADGRRVSGLRLREEMGRQHARERYAGPRSGWVEGSGMCWRAFKCGGAGRERRCDVLTVLLAGEGAGRGQGVLTMHGGAGSGGRRESPLVSHVFGRTRRGSTTRENGSETWAGLTPCTAER